MKQRNHKSKYEDIMPDYLKKALKNKRDAWEKYQECQEIYRSLYSPWHQDLMKERRSGIR